MKGKIEVNEMKGGKAVVYVSDNIVVRPADPATMLEDMEKRGAEGQDEVVIYVGGNVSVRRAEPNC